MLFLLWVVPLVLVSVLYYRQYTRFSRRGVKNLAPFPFLGDMAKLTFGMAQFFENVDKIYRTFPGERFVGSFEFTRPVIIIRDIDLVKQITIKDVEHFLDHTSVVDETMDPLFGRTLFALKGQRWKDMRVTITRAFTSSKMKMMMSSMMEAGDNMINKIKKNLESEDYYDLDFKDLCTRFANDVIASCILGIKEDSQNVVDSQFYTLARDAFQFKFLETLKFFGFQSFPSLMKGPGPAYNFTIDGFETLGLWGFGAHYAHQTYTYKSAWWTQLVTKGPAAISPNDMFKMSMFTEETLNFFKALVTRIMQERMAAKIHRPDLIHILMQAKTDSVTNAEDKESTGEAELATVKESKIGKKSNSRVLSDEDLIAQAILFSIGGLEAIGQLMTFLVHELAFNVDVQKKLVQEIREHDRKNSGKVDFKSIHEMKYLDMVISETLRLWTPGGSMDRLCTKDYNLGKPNDNATEDYIIRKGEGLRIPAWSFHRDPKYFPNPTKFDPERFSLANQHKIQPFTYVPFGLGARSCIVSRFAPFEIKVMVYKLLRQMEVSPCEKTCWPIKLTPGTLNIVMKGGHWIRLKKRV